MPRNEINVTSKGDPYKYIDYGLHLLEKNEFDNIVIKGSGSSIEVAFRVSVELRKKFQKLYQLIEVTSIEVDKRLDIPDEVVAIDNTTEIPQEASGTAREALSTGSGSSSDEGTQSAPPFNSVLEDITFVKSEPDHHRWEDEGGRPFGDDLVVLTPLRTTRTAS